MKTNLIDFKPVKNSLAQQRPDLFRKVKTLIDPVGQEHLPLRDGGDGYILNEELSNAIKLVYANKRRLSFEHARTAFASFAMYCSKQGVDDDLCQEWFQYNCQRWATVA